MARPKNSERLSESDRFDSKLKRMPNGCLEWTGTKVKDGYGLFRKADGTMQQANRYAYERAYGMLPKHIKACHHCDNPPCCDPNHLFAGTDTDNAQDSWKKGRHQEKRKGQFNNAAKITDEQAEEIRERRKLTGDSYVKIALDYPINANMVSYICRGISRKKER
jgi:hypothetical protein